MNTSIPIPTPEPTPPDHRSGVVAVIGRPNVGKSTLFNRLLGQKIAITSPKPQTTRDQLLGIFTATDVQILFLDTPGLHVPEHKLGEYMVKVTEETIQEADVILWLVDINTPPKAEEEQIAQLLRRLHKRRPLPAVILGLNKVDQLPNPASPPPGRDQEYLALFNWLGQADAPTPPITTRNFSGLTGVGVAELLDLLRQRLPLGPRYYPEDQVTDLQMRFLVAELIREQALRLLQQEVPHSIAVEVDEFKERSGDMTYISAVIYVERDSQKAIVLGERGSMIKRIGQAARPAIEELVGTRVFLELWVKVWEKWRTREGTLRKLGYALTK